MSDRVLKWTVPVDDEPHMFSGTPVFVGCQGTYEEVQVWTVSDDTSAERLAQVYGTGQPIPEGAVHIGTTLAAEGNLVWHLFDVTSVGAPVWQPPTGPENCPIHHKHSKDC